MDLLRMCACVFVLFQSPEVHTHTEYTHKGFRHNGRTEHEPSALIWSKKSSESGNSAGGGRVRRNDTQSSKPSMKTLKRVPQGKRVSSHFLLLNAYITGQR